MQGPKEASTNFLEGLTSVAKRMIANSEARQIVIESLAIGNGIMQKDN